MLVVILIIILIAWGLYRYNKKTKIIRFYRPSCPACVASQKEWDRFKKQARHKKNIVIIDVNTENKDEHTNYWTSKYQVVSVPYVVKITKWLGRSVEFKGDRTAEDYMRFCYM